MRLLWLAEQKRGKMRVIRWSKVRRNKINRNLKLETGNQSFRIKRLISGFNFYSRTIFALLRSRKSSFKALRVSTMTFESWQTRL